MKLCNDVSQVNEGREHGIPEVAGEASAAVGGPLLAPIGRGHGTMHHQNGRARRFFRGKLMYMIFGQLTRIRVSEQL
jgi:hypothetical protein